MGWQLTSQAALLLQFALIRSPRFSLPPKIVLTTPLCFESPLPRQHLYVKVFLVAGRKEMLFEGQGYGQLIMFE